MNNTNINQNLDPQALLNQWVVELMREKKQRRRWRMYRRVIVLLLVLLFAFSSIKFLFHNNHRSIGPHVGLINLNGKIADDAVNADDFAKSMAKAYKAKGLKALILRINSPGGSPVQADYIYNLIQSYRSAYPAIKIHAVCTDMCASAAYYIAAAANDIYANESSMVGSIGVVFNGFGFVDAMEKLGITRRLQTAGANKGFLDPFSPVSTSQQQWLQTMLNEVHAQFIAKVKAGRGERLKINDQTFSGLIWTGKSAQQQGLIDGFASSRELARYQLKLNKIIDYSYKPDLMARFGKTVGVTAAEQVMLLLDKSNYFSI